MKFFLDTEFVENGKTIDLISIGMVTLSGAEFYKVSTEARLDLASPWVREHVLPSLPSYSDKAWMDRDNIRRNLESFVTNWGDGEKNEFWGYYADYDWVALCQLFGTMMDLPKRFPRFCMDLKQYSVMCGNPEHPKQESGAHNALEDARWNRKLYTFLRGEK